jgi:hypothetical protein
MVESRIGRRDLNFAATFQTARFLIQTPHLACSCAFRLEAPKHHLPTHVNAHPFASAYTLQISISPLSISAGASIR